MQVKTEAKPKRKSKKQKRAAAAEEQATALSIVDRVGFGSIWICCISFTVTTLLPRVGYGRYKHKVPSVSRVRLCNGHTLFVPSLYYSVSCTFAQGAHTQRILFIHTCRCNVNMFMLYSGPSMPALARVKRQNI